MAFPVDEKYIKETELKVEFPTEYKTKMIKNNGGELISDDYEFELYPFFDKSDKKELVELATT
ncbi:SMI1/KNR4 family protein [Flammeovirga sp. SJP92]|uniref:SMI1/KNR4 family protein n=1 Tax=Flammeovirga sp. SJP92 TaxID=1775430 RepID=UPI000A603BD1|nr:SMI1/KNR4 family protein [Flammeovirga sp. SJP92]